MGCYLEDYRARVGAWAGRFTWRGGPRRGDAVAGVLGIKFVDPNCWTEGGDFARDGLHLIGRGKRRLGHLYARVSGLDVEASTVSK
ncbi:hypothetical protein B7P43_G10548 [Cryptotermes secundus]|uniref:Uncharacterized protein n=1 Tax=Cryptotermes secundus TaxID=105785 RepID=A0A2J7PRZ9_9NEOP|nr:hypothetical protein B7P43_G10548 [Cryptotermes secundus]